MRSPLNGNPTITCDAPCHGYGATDWGVGEGTPVYAMFAGTIDTFWLNGGGNTFDLHGDGLRAHYAHLLAYAVPDGATIAEGQLVAYSGDTGTLSSGPHLHVGLLDNAGGAIYVNGAIAGPFEYLNSIGYNWSSGGTQPLPSTQKYLTKAGQHMMYLGEIGSGRIAAIPEGGSPYVFKSPAEYNSWRSIVQTYNAMPNTPPQNILVVPPVLDSKELLFVYPDKFNMAIEVQS